MIDSPEARRLVRAVALLLCVVWASMAEAQESERDTSPPSPTVIFTIDTSVRQNPFSTTPPRQRNLWLLQRTIIVGTLVGGGIGTLTGAAIGFRSGEDDAVETGAAIFGTAGAVNGAVLAVVARSASRHFRRAAPDRGTRWKTVLVSVAAGAAIGALTGIVVDANSNTIVNQTTDYAFSAKLFGALGIVTGAVTGAVVADH